MTPSTRSLLCRISKKSSCVAARRHGRQSPLRSALGFSHGSRNSTPTNGCVGSISMHSHWLPRMHPRSPLAMGWRRYESSYFFEMGMMSLT